MVAVVEPPVEQDKEHAEQDDEDRESFLYCQRAAVF